MMGLPVAMATAVGLLCTPAGSAAPADPVSLVRVDTPTAAAVQQLAALGLDLATEPAGHTDVVIHRPADLAALRSAGFSPTVLAADLPALERAGGTGQPAAAGLPSGRTSYRAFADYQTELAGLAAANPTKARTFTLPQTSLEGRPVGALEISRDVAASAAKPVFLLTGLHHAREWPSSEVTLEYAYDLLKNDGIDPRITRLLDQARVIVVPVVNPDGFKISRELAYEMKRKNCRVRDGQRPAAGECAQSANRSYGVDLNRNYGSLWGDSGSSTSRTSELYRGAGGFSEPESQNIRDLVSARQVTVLVSNHTYGAVVLRPQGPEETLYKPLGDALSGGPGYSSSTLQVGGMTERWSYDATGGFGFTVEIGQGSFHPAFDTGVVRQYTGDGTRKGLRELYLTATEAAVDRARHSVLTGKAPAGAQLSIAKSFNLTTSTGQAVPTSLSSALTVPASGTFSWDVNPSVRPGKTGMIDENWTVTCKPVTGQTVTRQVLVRRGQQLAVDLTGCGA